LLKAKKNVFGDNFKKHLIEEKMFFYCVGKASNNLRLIHKESAPDKGHIQFFLRTDLYTQLLSNGRKGLY